MHELVLNDTQHTICYNSTQYITVQEALQHIYNTAQETIENCGSTRSKRSARANSPKLRHI